MYEIISLLRPYFFSLREINGNVSLDIKLPLTWTYKEIVTKYINENNLKTSEQDKNDKFILISLISVANSEGYEILFTCAFDIITKNKELEEKKRLFQEKVKELELIFQKESLEKLKEITILDKYGEENSTGVGVVGQGDGEGQDGDNDTQGKDD